MKALLLIALMGGEIDFDEAYSPAKDCTGETDDYQKLQSAINQAQTANGESVVRLGCGCYWSSQRLVIKNTMMLVGECLPHGRSAARTTIEFDDDVGGILFDYNDATPSFHAGGSVIRNLYLQGNGSKAGAVTDAHGIKIEAPRIFMDNIRVVDFTGNGIHIQAGVGATPSTNANGWFALNVHSVSNRGSGMFLEDGDSNAGVALGLNTNSNLEWCIDSGSFLGNYFIGGHCTPQYGTGAIRETNNNSYSVYLGQYIEGSSEDVLLGNAAVFQGNGGARTSTSGGQGLSWSGPNLKSGTMHIDRPDINMYLGGNNDSTPLWFDAANHTTPALRATSKNQLHYSPGGSSQYGWFLMCPDNYPATCGWGWKTDAYISDTEKPMQFWLRGGTWIGGMGDGGDGRVTGGDRAFIGTSSVTPTRTDLEDGSIFINTDHATNPGIAGWSFDANLSSWGSF